jgi:hypothetical protein
MLTALHNWVPEKLFFEGSHPFCKWLYVGDNYYTEPFFDETISTCRRSPPGNGSLKSVSSLEVLPCWSQDIESIQPSALIFHISRCGSTLVSQLLSLSFRNIVLSEVSFFDELLRSKELSPELLKAAITFYAAKRKRGQDHLFIKTDSWHIFFYQQLRELYPHTPFILLYRRPDEVVRSQLKRKGMHAVPGLLEPELLGFDSSVIMNMHPDNYIPKVLEKYFSVFLDILKKDALAFPVNYNEGAISIVKKIADLTGILITEGELNKMKERANYHAKYPAEIFSEEQIHTPVPRNCIKAFQLYEATEKIRNALTCAEE